MFSDLKFAFRQLARSPGFTAVAVLALALGIGANTVIFTAFNAVLLRPLPYHEPDRIVTVWDSFPQFGVPKFGVTYANMMDIKERNHVFAPLGVYVAASTSTFTLAGANGPERVQGTLATGDFFDALGVAPLLGRRLTAEDELPGREHVVVLGHGLWQRYFNGDRAIVGRTLKLNDEDYEVVGVMPPGFEFPSGAEMPPGQRFAAATEIWTPFSAPTDPARRNDRITHFLRAIARLKPGVSLDQARAEMATLTEQLAKEHPDENQGLLSELDTLRDNQVAEVRPALLVLLGSVALVLLIACANVANLLLARASVRQKEFTIRAALGAGRGRIARQLLTESVLLSVLGGGLGLALAVAGTRALVAFAPAGLPRIGGVSLDGRVLCFTGALSLLTGIIFGLAPALHASGTDLSTGLKDSARGASGDARQNRLRSLLVVVEVALVFVLLVAAGLMLRSFHRLLDVPPGFDASGVLTARVTLPAKAYPPAKRVQFYRQLVDRLGHEPGVQAAAIVRDLPLSGTDPRYGFSVAAHPVDPQKNAFTYRYRVISAGYFSAMAIPLKRGRLFNDHDDATSPGVVLVNETAARVAWPGEDPIGQVIDTGGGPAPEHCVVIGIVGDVKFGGLDTPPDLEVFYHYPQVPEARMNGAIGSMAVVARAAGRPATLTEPLRRTVAALDKDVPVSNVKPMDELLAGSVAARRFNLLLLGGFAGVALLLAAIGIYGVISYTVAQRTREFGIRLALGAQRRDVLGLIFRQGGGLVVLGLVVGAAASFALSRFVSSLLFGVSARDPLTFTVIAALLAAVAFLACWLPARRATKVDPMVALRAE